MSICEELCIELNDLCAHNCIHCSTDATQVFENHKSLPIDSVQSLLWWFAAQGGKLVEFSGGEPLLYKNLLEAINTAHHLNLEVRIYTSGDSKINLTPDKVEYNTRHMINKGLDGAVFSLLGANAQTHEKITQIPGSFAKTISNIQLYVSLGLWVGIHFVPMKPNYQDVEAMVALASTLNVQEIAFLRFVPQGRGAFNKEDLELSYEEFQELLKSLSELKDNRIRIGCPLSFSGFGFEPKKCRAGISTALVDASGIMHICPAFKNLPGITTKDFGFNWGRAWTNCQQYGINDIASRGLLGDCMMCVNFDECLGKCAAQRYLTYGNIMIGPDPMCPIIKEK